MPLAHGVLAVFDVGEDSITGWGGPAQTEHLQLANRLERIEVDDRRDRATRIHRVKLSNGIFSRVIRVCAYADADADAGSRYRRRSHVFTPRSTDRTGLDLIASRCSRTEVN